MKTVNEIKQKMELVEIVKSALDVNGQVAQQLIKGWMGTESDKLLKSVNEVVAKSWSDTINKIESENPVEVKKEFNLQYIPLQLLTKVNKDISSREIELILNAIKSIIPSGVTKYDKEGIELGRIERILENRIEENLKSNEYKSLEINVRLLQKIKEGYKPFRPIGCRA